MTIRILCWIQALFFALEPCNAAFPQGNPANEVNAESLLAAQRAGLGDAAAIRASAPSVLFVMAESNAGGEAKYRDETLESISVRGVTKEYLNMSTTTIEPRWRDSTSGPRRTSTRTGLATWCPARGGLQPLRIDRKQQPFAPGV